VRLGCCEVTKVPLLEVVVAVLFRPEAWNVLLRTYRVLVDGSRE